MTHEEFKIKAKEVVDTCNKYGFMANTIMPYGFKMTVEEFTRNWADYDRCTDSSKAIMRSELRGFLPILENWVKLENEPKVKVRYLLGSLVGKIKEHPESIANEFVEMGFAELV